MVRAVPGRHRGQQWRLLTGRPGPAGQAARPALGIDAAIHLQNASRFDDATITEGDLFRVEAGPVVVAGLLVPLQPRRGSWVIAVLVGASALAAVLVYRGRARGTWPTRAPHQTPKDGKHMPATPLSKILYTAEAVTEGGRAGHGRTSDGRVDLQLSVPEDMGGQGGPGTNPEQLFALAYAACFQSALLAVAQGRHLDADDAQVTARVGIGPTGHGGFGLQVALDLHAPQLPPRASSDHREGPDDHAQAPQTVQTGTQNPSL